MTFNKRLRDSTIASERASEPEAMLLQKRNLNGQKHSQDIAVMGIVSYRQHTDTHQRLSVHSCSSVSTSIMQCVLIVFT